MNPPNMTDAHGEYGLGFSRAWYPPWVAKSSWIIPFCGGGLFLRDPLALVFWKPARACSLPWDVGWKPLKIWCQGPNLTCSCVSTKSWEVQLERGGGKTQRFPASFWKGDTFAMSCTGKITRGGILVQNWSGCSSVGMGFRKKKIKPLSKKKKKGSLCVTTREHVPWWRGWMVQAQLCLRKCWINPILYCRRAGFIASVGLEGGLYPCYLSACGCLAAGNVIWKALQVWSSAVKVLSEKEGDVIRQDLPAVNLTFNGEGSPAADVPHCTDSRSEPHWPGRSCRWHEPPSLHFLPFAHKQKLRCYLLS